MPLKCLFRNSSCCQHALWNAGSAWVEALQTNAGVEQFSLDWVSGSDHLVLLPYHWTLRQRARQSGTPVMLILTERREMVTVIVTECVISLVLFLSYSHDDSRGFYRSDWCALCALVSGIWIWIESAIDDGDVWKRITFSYTTCHNVQG